jgi:hypothetical protein
MNKVMERTGVQARDILGKNSPCPKTRELTVVTAIKNMSQPDGGMH